MVKFREGAFGTAEGITKEALKNPQVITAIEKYESGYRSLIAIARGGSTNYHQRINIKRAATDCGNDVTAITAMLKKHAGMESPVAQQVCIAIVSATKESVLPSGTRDKADIEKAIADCMYTKSAG